MPRSARHAPGGYIYHALNRAVARLPLFKKNSDYVAFLKVVDEALARHPMRILSYCIMPNHWHFVLWPRHDGEMSDFLRWLTHTHTMRWHAHHRTVGSGHLYQGRFKAFPVQNDDHLLTLLRYVERNPLRAKLVKKAEDWPWSSLWLRGQGINTATRLSKWPIAMPKNWIGLVNRPQTDAEVEALRRSVQRGTPFGSELWQKKIVAKLGLEYTLRLPGRPKKEPD